MSAAARPIVQGGVFSEDNETTGADGQEEDDKPLGDDEFADKESEHNADDVRWVVFDGEHVGVIHSVADGEEKVTYRQVNDEPLSDVPLPE